jgi:hypothetical protein
MRLWPEASSSDAAYLGTHFAYSMNTIWQRRQSDNEGEAPTSQLNS